MTDQADMEARAQAIFEGVLKDDQFIPRRRDIIVAMLAYAAERETAAYARASEVARDRIPAVQCMSVEPVVAACEDIAAAILSLKEGKG